MMARNKISMYLHRQMCGIIDDILCNGGKSANLTGIPSVYTWERQLNLAGHESYRDVNWTKVGGHVQVTDFEDWSQITRQTAWRMNRDGPEIWPGYKFPKLPCPPLTKSRSSSFWLDRILLIPFVFFLHIPPDFIAPLVYHILSFVFNLISNCFLLTRLLEWHFFCPVYCHCLDGCLSSWMACEKARSLQLQQKLSVVTCSISR